MALSIKTHEADALARELASLTSESITEAVTTALRERLERIRRTDRGDYRTRVARLVAEYNSAPLLDDRSPDEILGYDEHGLPA